MGYCSFSADDLVVRIVTSDIFSGDAIGNFILQIRSFLDSKNIPNKLYATNYDIHAGLSINHFDEFFDEYTDNDVLLSHYSIYEERNRRLLDVNIPKAVYFHGITPPEYFDSYDEITARNCRKGLEQYNCFSNFDYYMSNSAYMLDQLLSMISGDDNFQKNELSRRSLVCPPFINSTQWDYVSSDCVDLSKGKLALLYVGRLAPHKAVHELFELLEVIVSKGVDASLRIVGGCAASIYCQELNDLLNDRYIGIKERVMIYGHVTQSKLKYLYESSDVFVTMSEHEGFCVPLVEAMRFSLPILAKGSGAIPETLSGSGMVFYDNDYEKMADYLVGLMQKELKDSVLSKQDAVYGNILKAADGEIILSVLEKLVKKRSLNRAS